MSNVSKIARGANLSFGYLLFLVVVFALVFLLEVAVKVVHLRGIVITRTVDLWVLYVHCRHRQNQS